MTNKNSDMSPNKKCENIPFMLSPAWKNYLWGGTRLNDDFSKEIESDRLAETWECSTHPDGPSYVASGEFKGLSLKDVIDSHKGLLGTHPKYDGGLPILIKFIDADKDLSVQVHPSDNYAKQFEDGSLGKTEMWYVLEATEGAQIVYGFSRDMSEEMLRQNIADSTFENCLRKISVKKNDVFFIPAGTVHAIGGGILLAEIQERSNITYRLYDYNRIDKNGRKRELHIDKALEVANLKKSIEPRQPMRVLKFQPGVATELICRCKYFEVSSMMLNTERIRDMAAFQTGSNSFHVLLCTDGCGVYVWKNEFIPFYKGDCLFVPANSVLIHIHGKAKFLDVGC